MPPKQEELPKQELPEVALDFKDCLEDLQINNRYEISNLTIIAKENTEEAQAISNVLESHINTTAPPRKLPALYVLDSIVKNVGTPYTVYLGRNLFKTFMEAYTLVDPATRRSMDGMLKTWKEPVPGSTDKRPVFPPEVIRPLENALIKARTVLLQTSRPSKPPTAMPLRPVSATQEYRNTPTPPQHASLYPAPTLQPFDGYRSQQPTPQQVQPSPSPALMQSIMAALNSRQTPKPTPALSEEIQDLISRMQQKFAQNPFDKDTQTKLKALLDLQNIVKSQQMSAEATNMIRAQISQLAAGLPPVSTPAPAPSAFPVPPTPQWQPPTPVQPTSTPVYQPPVPPPAAQTPAPSAFAPGMLEQLLASTANGQKPSTPQMSAALPILQNLPQVMQAPRPAISTPTPAPLPTANLMEQLRLAGIVQPSSTPAAAAPPPPPPVANPAASLLQQLQGLSAFIPPIGGATAKVRIPRSQAALENSFSPAIVSSLYEAQPNQCSLCGRRFPGTDEGRKKKAAHLDWHFRNNQRIADAVHKGQNRSWYVDDIDWIQLPTTDITSSADAEGEAAKLVANKAAERKKGPKDLWVPAPTGAAANVPCPICQERFEAVWHEEAQEWVWMDAKRVGGRVYHATCHEEVAGARGRSATPEVGVLGKRKAEDGLAGLKAKIKRDGA